MGLIALIFFAALALWAIFFIAGLVFVLAWVAKIASGIIAIILVFVIVKVILDKLT